MMVQLCMSLYFYHLTKLIKYISIINPLYMSNSYSEIFCILLKCLFFVEMIHSYNYVIIASTFCITVSFFCLLFRLDPIKLEKISLRKQYKVEPRTTLYDSRGIIAVMLNAKIDFYHKNGCFFVENLSEKR